jgi:pimeloyl-ACP methyl ester carboxylesterase
VGVAAGHRLAIRHPERVRRLVLHAPSLGASDLWPNGRHPATSADPEGFVAQRRAALATIEMQEGLDAVQFDIEPLLEELTTPTLVVHRRGDRACPFSVGKYVATCIPGAQFVPLDGDAHFPWVGDWQSISRAIVDFLPRPA